MTDLARLCLIAYRSVDYRLPETKFLYIYIYIYIYICVCVCVCVCVYHIIFFLDRPVIRDSDELSYNPIKTWETKSCSKLLLISPFSKYLTFCGKTKGNEYVSDIK